MAAGGRDGEGDLAVTDVAVTGADVAAIDKRVLTTRLRRP